MSGNILIYGDNLVALKALQKDYAGMVRCIYIDPPYNTGLAFENYNDKLGGSWLDFMRPRLLQLRLLLAEGGLLFIQIDDNEMAYLKVLLDEIFGRQNYVNTITVKMKNIAGASGGGQDKRLKKNIEFILVYTKNYSEFKGMNPVYIHTPIEDVLQHYSENNISWKYTAALTNKGRKEHIASTADSAGNEILIYKRHDFAIRSIGTIMREENISRHDVYKKYFDSIFRTTIPQSSIRTTVMKEVERCKVTGVLFSIEYTPKTGKHKGALYEQFYKGEKFNLLAWFSDVGMLKRDTVYKLDRLGTLWDKIDLNNLTKEGGIPFRNGKKPEKLLRQIIELSTAPGDLVLDAFLGSGTTAAVAHKMNRRWIGIECGPHMYTHCLPRLNAVAQEYGGGFLTIKL